MSSPDAAAESSAPPQRVVFPNVLERPELHTPYAWFRRHILLFGLYSVWVCGLGFMTGMWLYSFVCIGRTALSLGATPMPWVVQLYLLAMALYYSTHRILFYAKPQGEWKELRAIGRHSLVKYPYFRHAVCIFEDREEECIKEPCKPMVPPNDKLLTAYHPHGVLSAGFAFNGVHSMRFQESDARWLVAENLFWFPLLRDILHWLNFDDVSRDTFVGHMKQDRNVSLIPGGFEEATVYERGKHRAFIKNRFGFIKLALQFGYKVRAAYTFGEEETFHAMPYFLKQRMMLNYWKVPGVVFYGRLLCFFLPLENLELTTVISKPIQMPQIENPTREDVAKYHQIYIDTLVALFERNKHKYAKDPTATLEIF